MIVKAHFVTEEMLRWYRLHFLRQYWEADPRGYVESEAMSLGYQGA